MIKSRMQFKVIMIYMSIITLVLLVFGLFIFKTFLNQMEKDVLEKNETFISERLTEQINSYFFDEDQILKSMIIDTRLQNTLDEINKSEVIQSYDIIVYERIFEEIINDKSSFPTILNSNIIITNVNGNYTYEFNSVKEPMVNKVLENKEDQNYMDIFNRKCVILSNSFPESNTISMIRAIWSLKGELLGYIEIQRDIRELDSICNWDGSKVYLLAKNGELIYQNEDGNQKNVAQRLLEVNKKQTSIGDYLTDNLYYTWNELENYSYVVYVEQNIELLFSSVDKLKILSTIIFVIIFLFSLITVYSFSNVILKPIKELQNEMVNVNFSNMEINEKNNWDIDEIAVFRRTFTEMLERIECSTNERIAAQKAEERAIYAALQAQISPHFIHNTLFVISICIDENRLFDAKDMCKKLSDMLRYNVNTEDSIVTLEEEICHCFNYLELEKKSYEDMLVYSFDICEEMKTIRVPKLFMQPFVENCIRHGFANSEPPYIIKITGCRKEQGYFMTIEDNGIGISEEQIEQIYEKVKSYHTIVEHNKIGGMGMINSVLRLQYSLGEKNCFHMRNTNPGTIVEIFLGEGVRC